MTKGPLSPSEQGICRISTDLYTPPARCLPDSTGRVAAIARETGATGRATLLSSNAGIMRLSRRSFIKLTGTTAVCTCIGALGTGGCGGNPTSSTPNAPAGSYRVQDGRVYLALSELGILLDVGGAVKLTVGDVNGGERKVIVVRPGEADYRAFANACTHNGKELDYLHGEGLLACCGRGSRFDLAGSVLHGPAEDPLLGYRVWREGDVLVIET